MQAWAAPCPAWIVSSAGTGGGTLEPTIRRFVATGGTTPPAMCGVDAERSVFFDHFVGGDPALTLDSGLAHRGHRRPRVEANFVPDALGCHGPGVRPLEPGGDAWLSRRLRPPVGGTSTNLVAALLCARRPARRRAAAAAWSRCCATAA